MRNGHVWLRVARCLVNRARRAKDRYQASLPRKFARLRASAALHEGEFGHVS